MTKPSRSIVVVVAAVVAVAAIGLMLAVRDRSEPAGPDEPIADHRSDPRSAPSPREATATAEPRADPTTSAGTAREPVEYEGEGGRVRDHRGRDVEVDPDHVVTRPFESIDIDSKLIAAMGAELHELARRCQGDHPSEVHQGARVQPRVTFTVGGGELSVTAVKLGLIRIEAGGDFESCVREGSIDVVVAATGHRDVERHTMTVNIALEPR